MLAPRYHGYSSLHRDISLVFVGAAAMFVVSAIFPLSLLRVIDSLSPYAFHSPDKLGYGAPGQLSEDPSRPSDVSTAYDLPSTSIIAHTPGWTVFRNLYMSNGTLFLVAASSSNTSFPDVRMMTSTGLPGDPTPESIAEREPTRYDMDVISLTEARDRWGMTSMVGHRNRVSTLKGNTLLVNDPDQFLPHYYHFVAELFFGVWAFWSGIFGSTQNEAWTLNRAIFIHASFQGWHDRPGFNAFFVHGIFPSMSVEVMSDWQDRVLATRRSDRLGGTVEKAWHFPVALLADRSAAFRGETTGARTQRTAAGPWEYMVSRGKLDLVGNWWGTIRDLFLTYIGDYNDIIKLDSSSVNQESAKDYPFGQHNHGNLSLPAQLSASKSLPTPDKVVLSYISRQGGSRRRLNDTDHINLVSALQDLVRRKGDAWQLNVVQAETLTKDEQVRIAARTTVLIGVHGNGLTHLLWMQPTRASAVIEIFWPGGFARDYEWTSNAIGINHFSVWNDTILTRPNEPSVAYPVDFHSASIPVYGPGLHHGLVWPSMITQTHSYTRIHPC